MSDHNLNVNAKLEIPPSVDNAVSNLTNKPTSSIGSGIADIVDLVFGPVSYQKQKQQIKYAAKLDQFKSELNEKINSIPKENIKEPDFQTAALALDASKYCLESDELRNMFANLISSTMDTRLCSQAHPSFAEIIKQMSPLDAQNLALFKDDLPVAEYRVYEPSEEDINDLHLGSYNVIKTNVFLENKSIYDLDLQATSISSLSRLGLIEISYEHFLTNDILYKPYETDTFLTEYNSTHCKQIDITKGRARKTPLGESFIEVCLP